MGAHSLTRRAFLAGLAAVGLTACDTPVPAAVPVHHQPGVLAPSPPAAGVAAYDVTARTRAELTATLRAVTSRGVTVAVGASLFDGRFGLRAPRRLTTMPKFPGDVLEEQWCHGDLLLQALADTPDQVDSQLADVPGLTLRWRINGHHLPEDRNAFGFKEGAGNPTTPQVWVGEDEPACYLGGTYQVVRLIRLAMPTWDHKSTEDQERVFGRRKESGEELPDLLNSHVRRARPAEEKHKILRRGYPFVTEPGHLFMCYQRDPETGFAAAQRRLAGEELEKYVLPFGGGYFFTLPGTDGTKDDYLGRAMVESS